MQNITFSSYSELMKLKYINIPLLFLLVIANTATLAQDWFPEESFLYDQASVARIDISIDPNSLDIILDPDSSNSNVEYQAVFTFERGGTSSTIDSVGFRLRGNTSRVSAKKSFKVSLNTFVPGQKYYGVEKININGEHNDPSISRAHICWELFRRAGVPAPRSGHTELYINGEYKGLYINVEHIDEEFVKLRFGNDGGNLYKCLWPADLAYVGENPDVYKFESYDRPPYELKTNLLTNDYSDLADFIKILHEKDPDDFPQYLEPVFNVNTYLKNLAVEVLTGHWDAYSYNKNNYYLYHNVSTGKFEFIPYDPDNTLGISWPDRDWTQRDVYNWSKGGEDRPLTKKILQNDIYRDRYSFFMKRFLDEEFNATRMNPFVDNVKSRIQSFAENDVYRTYDYSFSYADFLNSFDQSLGSFVKEGIKPYISKRNASAWSQLDVNEIAPAVTMASINRPDVSENLKISALVEDELTVSDVTAYFSENGGDFSAVPMINTSGDLFFVSYPGINSTGYVSFYIEATDQQINTTREPPFGAYIINYGPVSVPQTRYSHQIDISVYPNPAHSWVSIDAKSSADSYTFGLYNISGQKVLSGTSFNSKFTIDLNDGLMEGIYFLELGYIENGAIRYQAHKKVLIRR